MRKAQIACYQIRSEKIGSFFYADEAEAREEIRKCAEGDNPLYLEFIGKTVQNHRIVFGADAQKKMNGSVKNWYKETYPADTWATRKMSKDITFADILENPWGIYGILNVGDSLVRERVFKEIDDIHLKTQ
jgi:hypothetical protein